MEGGPKQFASAEEEIAYLRQEIAKKERVLLERAPEADNAELETLGKETLREYGTFTPEAVLQQEQQLAGPELTAKVEQVDRALSPVDEIIDIAKTEGIRNALSVMEKSASGFVTDEVHRQLVELVKSGVQVQGLKEGTPPWQVLHMTLFEVVLPEHPNESERQQQLATLFGTMEQFLAGMQALGQDKRNPHFAIEIANPEGSDHIAFYVSVPNQYIDLFQKQLLSLYPHAVITEQQHDYNIFVDGGSHVVATGTLARYSLYPLRHSETFDVDPLAVLLNAFSRIEKMGAGAAVQFLVRHVGQKHTTTYNDVIKRVQKGMSPKEAIQRSSISGEVWASMVGMMKPTRNPAEGELPAAPEVDQVALEKFQQKMQTPLLEVNIRVVTSAAAADRAAQVAAEIEATFNQFEDALGNHIRFKRVSGSYSAAGVKRFSFRQWEPKQALPLSMDELSTILHFPSNGMRITPEFKQSQAKTAAAPTDLPAAGTLLGVNAHQGSDRPVYITPEDRMRHFYIIGQTGTGKTTLMKNMIVQDIQAGHGVCMIDPHGTDIEDVLGAVPPEREADVIYFDPSRMDRVVGLNMLEYDVTKPEQKTFVVNELFSIFQKLYGAVPESMGPMFEQYFRNATMLVLEDPASGSTLMDISRVMADASYRRAKLQKATNPVVVQFWKEIATKAGGEAALENIVPYITSKFDVFTANDYMRPIIGQQQSAFDFRRVMDERKILLVNLSKGRLGEINANLIGMIIVGKLLMAALSRVDDPTKGFPDFYLHMDEFQNISTNSISAILSEARKYKLGLTVAHQFIAQLDEKIKDAVFGNVGSMVTFRVGPEDAQFLEHQYEPTFTANELINIPNRSAYVRALVNGSPTRPFSLQTIAPPEIDRARVERIIAQSYQQYGRDRAEVEAAIMARYQKPKPANPLARPTTGS